MFRTVITALVMGGCATAGAASSPTPAIDPGCHEDQAAVVAPDNGQPPDLDWVCVNLDDFADLDRLDAILAG